MQVAEDDYGTEMLVLCWLRLQHGTASAWCGKRQASKQEPRGPKTQNRRPRDPSETRATRADPHKGEQPRDPQAQRATQEPQKSQRGTKTQERRASFGAAGSAVASRMESPDPQWKQRNSVPPSDQARRHLVQYSHTL